PAAKSSAGCCPSSRKLVRASQRCCLANADARQQNQMLSGGVIDWLCRVRPEILTHIAKLGQQAFNCLFHFIAAMVGTNGNFAVDLAVCRGYTLQTDMALAREIRGERRNERRFIDP